jgi:hypothetical protein
VKPALKVFVQNDGDLVDAILLYFKSDNNPFLSHPVELTVHYRATILCFTAHQYTVSQSSVRKPGVASLALLNICFVKPHSQR